MADFFERKTCDVIDIPIDVGSISSFAKNIILSTSEPSASGGYICVANVHMLIVAHKNAKFRLVLKQSSLTIADGVPLVWTQKIKGFKDAERVCGPDLMLELCLQASQINQSIFLLGGSPSTLEQLTKKLSMQFPKLRIAGTYSPNFLPEEPPLDQNLVDQINNSGANLLFVGLGCPKQEFWCATHASYLKPLSIGVGAAFDFHAGKKKRAPLWMQKNGLEWLYRFISEPKRLFKRYLISNTTFLYYSLKDLITSRN